MEENTNAAAESRTIKFDYAGQQAHITFSPEVADAQLDAYDEQLKTSEGESAQTDALIDLLERTIEAWDFERGGQVLPITADVLRDISYSLLVRIVNEIAQSLGRHGYALNITSR